VLHCPGNEFMGRFVEHGGAPLATYHLRWRIETVTKNRRI
jgi:hypothetical protein